MNRVIILGSGCSLKGFNFWKLKNEKIFAVNKMFHFAPFAEHVCFWDGKFYDREKRKLNRLKSQLNSIAYYGIKNPKVRYFKNFGYGQIRREPLTVGNNNMSVLFAVNVAIHEGAKKIYLLGCDNKFGDGGKIHFYDNKPKTAIQHNIYKTAFEHMYELATLIKTQLNEDEKIITIGDTTLDMFDNISFEEFDKLL